MKENYIPKIWADKVIEQLDTSTLLSLEFKPKYKGNNKFIIWLCTKFKVGEYVNKFPNYLSDEMKKGTKVRIKTINATNFKDYNRTT